MTDHNKTTRYLIDDLTLDIQRGELTRNETVISLPKLSYDLLHALATASPTLLSQSQLMAIVWPDRVIGDETLKQRVKLLRKSLGDNASKPTYIEAVRGRGYRLIPQVVSECVVKAPPSVLQSSTPSFRWLAFIQKNTVAWFSDRSLLRKILMLLIVLFILIVLINISENNTQDLSIKTDNELSTLETITLSQYEKSNQLYHAARDYYHRYRKADNMIAIELFKQAIAQDSKFSAAYAGLSQAYSQLYFQFGGDKEYKSKAIDYAYHALRLDQNSAQSFKALGTAYYVSGWLSKSVATLHKGIEINPDEIEIMINLAYIYSMQGQIDKALLWHKKALTKAPNHAVAMMHTGLTLQRNKQYKAANLWYEKALLLQPDYVLTRYHRVQLAIEQQDYELATSIINAHPLPHPLMDQATADIAYYQGDLATAYKAYQQATSMKDISKLSRSHLMATLLSNQRPENATKQGAIIDNLKNLQLHGNEHAEVSLQLAEFYSATQKVDLAMRYFVQAIEQGYLLNYRVLQAPLFSTLRNHHDFKKFVAPKPQRIIDGKRKIGEY